MYLIKNEPVKGGENFFLDKCIFSYYAQTNRFYNSIMLCLRVIKPQMFYDVISALHQNVTMGPGRRITVGATMAEHACSSFFIENDNGSEVCKPVNSLRGISEYYSVTLALLSLYSPCTSLSRSPF